MMPKSSGDDAAFGLSTRRSCPGACRRERSRRAARCRRKPLDQASAPSSGEDRSQARFQIGPGRAERRTPSIHSIVRTSRVVRSQSILGARNVRLVPRAFPRKLRRRRRLEPEIHLHPHRARERLDHLHRLAGGFTSGASRSASRAAKSHRPPDRARIACPRPARSTLTATTRSAFPRQFSPQRLDAPERSTRPPRPLRKWTNTVLDLRA